MLSKQSLNNVTVYTNTARIRGHAKLQGAHETFEELLRQLRDLLWEYLADEGDELIILVTQRRELGTRERKCVSEQ